MAGKYGRGVVVLIDEYDYPVINHMDNIELAKANRKVLGDFYGVLKGQDANLRFVLVTGVSKFTRLSIFSKLNNLTDITMEAKYATICGITDREFDELFGSGLDGETREKVFSWYDGFSWDGTSRVFNPFSLLSFVRTGEFNSYWYATGVPTFLEEVFKDRPSEYLDMQNVTITVDDLQAHDIEDSSLVSLLFQTGFLTVISSDRNTTPTEYTLGFPNIEVSRAMGRLFLSSAARIPYPADNSLMKAMMHMLDNDSAQDIATPLEALYASIPHQLHVAREAYYHSIFLSVMHFLNFRAAGEVSVAGGRIDSVIERLGNVFVIEFKYEEDEKDLEKALSDAMRQIVANNYADPYEKAGKHVVRLAVAVAGRGKVKTQVL